MHLRPSEMQSAGHPSIKPQSRSLDSSLSTESVNGPGREADLPHRNVPHAADSSSQQARPSAMIPSAGRHSARGRARMAEGLSFMEAVYGSSIVAYTFREALALADRNGSAPRTC